MAEKTDAELESLAARLAGSATALPKPTDIATGEAAAERGRALMLREYGSQEALDEVLRTAGRPRLGAAPKGKSPVVRGSIAEADRVRLDLLIRQTGKKESELIREAVRLLLEQHKIAS